MSNPRINTPQETKRSNDDLVKSITINLEKFQNTVRTDQPGAIAAAEQALSASELLLDQKAIPAGLALKFGDAVINTSSSLINPERLAFRLRLCQQAIKIFRQTNNDPISIASQYLTLCSIYVDLNDVAQLKQTAQQALDAAKHINSSINPKFSSLTQKLLELKLDDLAAQFFVRGSELERGLGLPASNYLIQNWGGDKEYIWPHNLSWVTWPLIKALLDSHHHDIDKHTNKNSLLKRAIIESNAVITQYLLLLNATCGDTGRLGQEFLHKCEARLNKYSTAAETIVLNRRSTIPFFSAFKVKMTSAQVVERKDVALNPHAADTDIPERARALISSFLGTPGIPAKLFEYTQKHQSISPELGMLVTKALDELKLQSGYTSQASDRTRNLLRDTLHTQLGGDAPDPTTRSLVVSTLGHFGSRGLAPTFSRLNGLLPDINSAMKNIVDKAIEKSGIPFTRFFYLTQLKYREFLRELFATKDEFAFLWERSSVVVQCTYQLADLIRQKISECDESAKKEAKHDGISKEDPDKALDPIIRKGPSKLSVSKKELHTALEPILLEAARQRSEEYKSEDRRRLA